MGSTRVVAVLAAVCVCSWAQIEKPSPIPSRNKKQTVEAPPPKPKQETPQSGESQRSASVSGNTGTACFYKPKPDAAGAIATLRAVHPTMASGTKVRVTNLGNSKAVVVTITDHGDLAGRIISVSQDAADQLGFVRAGTAQVRLDVVE